MREPVLGQTTIGGKLLLFTARSTFAVYRKPQRASRGRRKYIRKQKALGVVFPRLKTTKEIVAIDPVTGTVELA